MSSLGPELCAVDRSEPLFEKDVADRERELLNTIGESRFLVVGGAGSVGQATVKELFRRNPRVLHVVDISENNLVELVRDIRSSTGYGTGDFATFAIDAGSQEFEACLNDKGPYDYVLNLSALKHVRSEKDPYTLMRLLYTNVINVDRIITLSVDRGAKRHFSVSTDKAANPVNIMGASKRLMEFVLFSHSDICSVGAARFANVDSTSTSTSPSPSTSTPPTGDR